MTVQGSYFSLTRNTPLSPGVLSFLEEDTANYGKCLGGILSDARLCWLARGPRLCIVDLKTGYKIAAWTFGATIGLNTSILCVSELPSPICENTNQLIVSLACEDIGGLVVVFHCNGSQVLRCIQTKTAITDLTVVERIDGPLSCCDNLVVAGTEMGEIIVFDLNRAALIEALKNISEGNERLVKNEDNSTNLAFLSLDDIELIEEQREIALESDDHLAINLNDQSFFNGEYILRNPDGSVRMKAKAGHVNVTKLMHVPQLGSLMVGFNFGGFQIWNLVRMCLEYTSPVNVECLPVTHFGFQEPCDDPRAFCYLWVIYSAMDRTQEACPLAVMYSLTYQGKRIPGATNFLYQDFSSCSRRFELDLTSAEPNLATQITGGRCIGCHTYCVPSSLYDGDEGVMNLCMLLWESWTDNANSSSYSMLLFDLDQWYKGHMPERWCVSSNMMMSVSCVDCPDSTLDCRMLGSTLAPYTHVQRLEEHFYPNSLQYSVVCLSPDAICQLSTTGIQRQILSSMDEMGPSCMLNPTSLYEQCIAAGLTPIYAELYHSHPEVNEQRKFLLWVALEGRLVGLLGKCAGDWASGTHSGAGCSLQLFVSACWQRALLLKRAAEPAEYHRNALRRLEHCVRQLTLIVNLLESVITKCCNLVVPDALSDIEERCKTIGTLTTYLRAVQWFVSVGLLPESSMEQEPHILHNGEERLPYPVAILSHKLEKRRIKLACLDGKSTCEDKPIASCPMLYIDQLIESECGGPVVHGLWRTDDNHPGLYPPPSLQALLRVYLLPDVADEHKHSLVLYLLLDVSSAFVDARYDAILRKLMQFPTMFGLSNAAIKTTQAFWHLDNRNFDFALEQLQCVSSLAGWQHGVVLSALLAQKKTRAGLQYVRGSANADSDWQSCCELYLSRSLVFEALEVVRSASRDLSLLEKAETLNFYFEGCKKTGQLSKILQISLTPLEENLAEKYLQASNDKQCADILVMFYMQQSRYLEAQRYNNKIKQTFPQKDSIYSSLESCYESNIDRDITRDTLVELVCMGLPNITDKVKASIDQIPPTPKVINVKPMSVFVPAKSPKNFVYKSSFIQNSIENASETWTRKPQLARGLKRALQIEDTPFLCTPKLSKFRGNYEADLEELEGITPRKRQRVDAALTPRTPHRSTADISKELLSMLQVPEVEKVPDWKRHADRSERSMREATPQSILKVRRTVDREQPSPVDSRYLADTDEELETASRHSNYTHASDKHLRFDLPSSSESSTELQPSVGNVEIELSTTARDKDVTSSNWTEGLTELPDQTEELAESPKATEGSPVVEAWTETPRQRQWSESPSEGQKKQYKDSVRARLSHSLSASSSFSDGPRSPLESISDMPVMIINPRYSAEKIRGKSEERERTPTEERNETFYSNFTSTPITPRSRPPIRSKSVDSQTSTRVTRSHSKTPESSSESPSLLIWSSPRPQRMSHSKTPEFKKNKESSNLEPIFEQPKLETIEEISSKKILRTPEKIVKETVVVSQRKTKIISTLETVAESPSREAEETVKSPLRRSLRSRSRTPEIESPIAKSPAIIIRRKSKTPERELVLSPKLTGVTKSAKKKPLSRLVMEANIFSKIVKTNVQSEESSPSTSESSKLDAGYSENVSVLQSPSESILECTPMKDKPSMPISNYEFSPIVDKSVLGTSDISVLSYTSQSDISVTSIPSSKTSTTLSTTFLNKSVLGDYKSSSDHSESNSPTELDSDKPTGKRLDYSDSPTDPLSNESVLKDISSTPAESIDNSALTDDLDEPATSINEENVSNVEFKGIQTEKQKIVEIEREINEIEEQMEGSDESRSIVSEIASSVSVESGDTENEVNTEDSGNDTETDESDQEIESGSEDSLEANTAAFMDESKVISLDSSDEDCVSPPKRAKMTPSPDSKSSFPLQIDDDSNEAKFSESNSGEDELERNIDSNLDTKSSESNSRDDNELEENIDSNLDPKSSESNSPEDNELEKNIDSNFDPKSSESISPEDIHSNLDPSLSQKTKDNTQTIEIVKDPLTRVEVEKETGDLKQTSTSQDDSNTAVDIFNECNYSLMTEDNSVLQSDRSEMDSFVPETSSHKNIETFEQGESGTVADTEKMDTDENIDQITSTQNFAVTTKENSEHDPFENTEKLIPVEESTEVSIKSGNLKKVVTEEILSDENSDNSNKETLIPAKETSDIDIIPSTTENDPKPVKLEQELSVIMDEKSEMNPEKINVKLVPAKESTENKVVADIIEEQSKPAQHSTNEPINEVTEKEQSMAVDEKEKTEIPKSSDETDSIVPITRKRTSSNASKQSAKDKNQSDVEENKEKISVKISKRRTSAKSNKSDDGVPITPTRRRPSNISEPGQDSEIVEDSTKIKTRRASNKSAKSNEDSLKSILDITETEIVSEPVKITTRRASEKSADSSSKTSPKETPLRRSTRRSSKQSDDDNESVKSVESKPDELKAGPSRKQRKSLAVSSKPELSVIPEVEDSGISRLDDNSQVMQDYSSARRLTRNQRSLLERSLEASRPAKRGARRRSGSVASNASVAGSETSLDNSTGSDPFGVPPIDPISLLNKKDFEGPQDVEEMSVISEETDSPETVTSKSSKAKGASETGSIINLRHKRLSTDFERASSPTTSLDVSLTGSPGRPRRSSFNKALDALSTPKRSRRSSVDVAAEGDTDSVPGSPLPQTSKDAESSVTPLRRTRRRSSAQSGGTPVQHSPARRNLRSTSIAESIEENDEAKPSKKK